MRLPLGLALPAFFVALLFVLLQNGARRHFFRAFAVTAGSLSGFFDMFILSLLFRSDAA